MSATAATVGGWPLSIADVDDREARLRQTDHAAALPRPGTSEGRQLRRWLTQLLATERVIAVEADERSIDARDVPAEDELLPDVSARLEIGSVAASVLSDPVARALFVAVTTDVDVSDDDVAAYHDRNPTRFATADLTAVGWRLPHATAPPLDDVREKIRAHLLAAARRRAFRLWLDTRCADLIELAPGYEHPGDPRQPDNTHRH